jgi:hypothetical protein
MRRFVRQIQPLHHFYGCSNSLIQLQKSSNIHFPNWMHFDTAIRSVHSRNIRSKDITGLDDTNENETLMTPETEVENALMNEKRKKLVVELHDLADKENFDGILAMIWASYIPLARTYRLLDAIVTPLGKRFSAMMDNEWPNIPLEQLYDDTTTRLLEQEAIRSLVLSHKARYATQIYVTRHAFLKALENAPIEIKSQLSKKHYRSYYSWIIGAYSQLQEFDRVLEVYDEAIEIGGIFPTAAMNGQKIRALISEGALSQVLPFYQELVKKDAPMQETVYRNMLMYARLTQDRSLAEEILPEFELKGFKLTEKDYFNAMCTVDDIYFYRNEPKQEEDYKNVTKPHRTTSSTKKDHSNGSGRGGSGGAAISQKKKLPMEDFRTCLFEKDPSFIQDTNKFKTIEEAALFVLQLWDEMIQKEQIFPTNPFIYERVMTAVIQAEEYQRVEEMIQLYQKHVPLKHQTKSLTFHRMVVNAFLFLEEPLKAWSYVVDTKVVDRHRSMLFDILDFVCVHDDLELIQRILDDLKSFFPQMTNIKKEKDHRNRLRHSDRHSDCQSPIFLSNPILKNLLHTVIRNVVLMTDEQVWSFLKKHEDFFRLETNTFWMNLSLDQSAIHHRFELAKKIILARDLKTIPTIDIRKGLFLMKKSIQAKEYDLIVHEIYPAIPRYLAFKEQKEKAEKILTFYLIALDALKHPQEEIWKAFQEFNQVFGSKVLLSQEAQQILDKYR